MTASPCIGACRLDARSRYCLGCARTREEVVSWGDAPPAFLERVWSELPARRTKLGVSLHRLRWNRDELVEFLVRSLPSGGTWTFGDFGAPSEFRAVRGEPCAVEALGAGRVIARTPRAAVRFDIPDQIRILSRCGPGEAPDRGPIVLAVSRARPRGGSRNGLVALGADRDALDPNARDARLYDLGLPSRGATLCIRTADPALIEDLDASLGQGWCDLLARVGGRIARAVHAPVVMGPVGRIETAGPLIAGVGEAPRRRSQTADERGGDGDRDAFESPTFCATYHPDPCEGQRS